MFWKHLCNALMIFLALLIGVAIIMFVVILLSLPPHLFGWWGLPVDCVLAIFLMATASYILERY
jgi:inner membrane protein involved in colicin E2 resistance